MVRFRCKTSRKQLRKWLPPWRRLPTFTRKRRLMSLLHRPCRHSSCIYGLPGEPQSCWRRKVTSLTSSRREKQKEQRRPSPSKR